MILENVDAAKRTFTLKFSDTDIVHMTFSVDKWGYTEMRVEITKKDDDGKFMEGFTVSYHWNSEKDEAPAFVMDMMSLLNKLGKLGSAAGENMDSMKDTTEEAPPAVIGEEVAEEEVVEEEVVEEVIEEVKEEGPEGD